ncbi:MAG TPA: class I SAM-dependent methyltransferase [Marisediminicola sp.]|nr:class I SAM-dependent methyltransferase [Marisediminicola sp.]
MSKSAAQPLPPFTYRPRYRETTPELDRDELEWWENNAALMERIWTLPAPISKELRGEMARIAAAFFGSGRILEPGCGAGWPGRLIAEAGRGLRIVGTDISPEQVSLARQAAEEAGLTDACEYYEGEMSSLPVDDFDGAFFHAALHHLSDREVEEVLDHLATARAGFRVVFYEPVFVRPFTWLPRPFARVGSLLVSALLNLSLRDASTGPDNDLVSEMKRVEREASEHGWFLSPKEVPFSEQQLLAALRRRFDVVLAKPLHLNAIEAGQLVAATWGESSARDKRGLRIIRRTLWLDMVLLRSNIYRVCRGRYAFWMFALTVPAVPGQ